MANKPASHKYSDFRVFAEWMPNSKCRIKRELIPAMAAYLLMLGRRYERTAQIMEHKTITMGVPGMKESAHRMRQATEHIQWILDQLPVNFDRQDWRDAVAEVVRLMGIETGQNPIYDIPEAQFADLIPVPTDGSDESGSGADVQYGVALGAGSPTPERDSPPGRPRRTGPKGVGRVQGKR